MISKLLIFDTECNSLDTLGGFVMELGWAIFDPHSKRLLKAKSELIQWGRHYEVQPDAEAVTGLSRAFCEERGRGAQAVFSEFLEDCASVQCLAGHNIMGFDCDMMESNIKRSLFTPIDSHPFKTLPKIDTYFDCPYPPTQKQFSLKYLALDHGHVMTNAHQALADVFACAHVLFQYPFDKCLEIASTPLVTLSAYTDYHDQAARDRVYAQKFRWNREKKRWEKRTRAFYIPGIQLELNLNLLMDDQWLETKTPEAREPSSSELPF